MVPELVAPQAFAAELHAVPWSASQLAEVATGFQSLQLLFSFDSGTEPESPDESLSAHTRIYEVSPGDPWASRTAAMLFKRAEEPEPSTGSEGGVGIAIEGIVM